MKNENKIGLSTLEWILSIAGIVFLACLIILPPVFRIAFKEKKKDNGPTEIQIKTLVCSKTNYISEGTTNSNTLTFKYFNDRIRTYTIVLEKIYPDYPAYESEKQQLGLLSTAYEIVPGLNYTLTTNDSLLRTITTEVYDLGAFKSTSVTLPGHEQEIKVNSTYTLEDSITEITNDLTSSGYTCK